MSRTTKVALGAQVLLLVYLQVIEWIDLYPWNDVRNGNGQEALDVALGVFLLLALVATMRRSRSGIIAGALGFAVWMYLQITTFWVPYLVGATPRWQRIHAAHFAQTAQWLPTWDTHLPPDASHFVLQLILLVAMVATTATAVAALRKSSASAGPA